MARENGHTQRQIDEVVDRQKKHSDNCSSAHSKIDDRLAKGSKTMGILENRVEALEGWRVEQTKIIYDFKDTVEKKLADQTKLLVGILVALATASILMALNILIIRNGEVPGIIETLSQRLL